MHYVLDICILLITIITIASYCKKGFLKAILSFGKTIISVIIAFFFGKTVGSILAENIFNDKITDLIYNCISKSYGEGTSFFDLSRLVDKIPQSIFQLADMCKIDIYGIVEGYSSETVASADRLREVANNISLPISQMFSNICGYLIVFALTYLLLIIVAKLVGVVTELPIIRFVNRALGFLLGCICAFIYSWIFVLITKGILLCFLAFGKEGSIMEIIDKTYIFKLF